MGNETHEKIVAMRQRDINIGSLVEITIKEGAKWYNGYTEAPTTNPQGYEPPDAEDLLTGRPCSLSDQPGLRTVGYVANYEKDRVSLAPAWGTLTRGPNRGETGPVYDAGSLFVHADVIHSFRPLRGD